MKPSSPILLFVHIPKTAGTTFTGILDRNYPSSRVLNLYFKFGLTVKKFRELWMLENLRIHLDEVEGLGTFIEFEALVSKRYDVQECHARINRLRKTFGPTMGEPVGPSYSDLLAQTDSIERDLR